MGKGSGRGGSKECFRITLWMIWTSNMLITSIYFLLSAVTFYKLLTASGETALDVKSLALNRVWRAPLAATFLGSILVFGFNIFSCVMLAKKSVNRSGPGFGYGFLVAFCFTLAFFCLLVGLIMDSFREVLKDSLETVEGGSWSKYSTELYIGAEVFAFLCFALFMLFFLALVIFQGAVSDQLGITRDMNNPYQPMDVPAMAPAAAAAVGGDGLGLGGAGKAPSSSDPQYAQFATNEYMTTDQYNQGGYNQYYNSQYQQGTDYQNTTEYRANEYDQEQGAYQAYDSNYGTTVASPNAAVSTPAYSPQPAYAAPQYMASDYSAASAAAFHGQQGAYMQQPSGRPEQQL